MLAQGNTQALAQVVDEAHAIPTLAKLLLEEEGKDAQCALCLLLAALCSSDEEVKEAAVRAGVVPQLLKLVVARPNDSDLSLVEAASAALMHIVLVRSSKYALYESGGLPIIHSLLSSSSEKVQVHALESVTSLAEAPECKAKMAELGVLGSVQELEASTTLPHVARRCAQATRQLHFRARPFAALHL